MPDEILFTLIGDIVRSRESADRGFLQGTLRRSLKESNAILRPRMPLEATVGDEFQASFVDAPSAILASLLVRLAIQRQAGVDTRFGLGAGSIEVFGKGERGIVSQDGPGWWSARESIEKSRELAEDGRTSFVRTTFRCAEDAPLTARAEEGALNAHLFCRDAIVARMGPKNRSRLFGLLRGWPQQRIAAEERTTQSAISQSLSRSAAFAVLISQEELEGRTR